jgi:TP901-1 family phage major tail protein
MATILGKKLMLFVKDGETYKSIAYATNHTFTTSASTVSVASKDDADIESGAGKWDSQDLDMFSWSISAENLFAYEGNGMTAESVMEMYLKGQLLEVKFGLADTNKDGAPTAGWGQEADTKMLSGKAYITSLDINASNDGRATMSITLTGKGAVAYA